MDQSYLIVLPPQAGHQLSRSRKAQRGAPERIAHSVHPEGVVDERPSVGAGGLHPLSTRACLRCEKHVGRRLEYC